MTELESWFISLMSGTLWHNPSACRSCSNWLYNIKIIAILVLSRSNQTNYQPEVTSRDISCRSRDSRVSPEVMTCLSVPHCSRVLNDHGTMVFHCLQNKAVIRKNLWKPHPLYSENQSCLTISWKYFSHNKMMTDWLVAGGCQYSEGVINVENNQNLTPDLHTADQREQITWMMGNMKTIYWKQFPPQNHSSVNTDLTDPINIKYGLINIRETFQSSVSGVFLVSMQCRVEASVSSAVKHYILVQLMPAQLVCCCL